MFHVKSQKFNVGFCPPNTQKGFRLRRETNIHVDEQTGEPGEQPGPVQSRVHHVESSLVLVKVKICLKVQRGGEAQRLRGDLHHLWHLLVGCPLLRIRPKARICVRPL